MKTLRLLIILLLLAAGVTFVVWWRMSPETPSAVLTPAKISEIRSMVQLSTLDIYEEVPVKGNIGPRHLVARMAIEGNIAFDLEKLITEMHGDTLVVVLPPEIVTIRESTAPGSYQVIDSWNDKLLSPVRFTTAEENIFKQHAIDGAVQRIYADGYVKQARADAVASLNMLLSTLVTVPVRVVESASVR